MPKKAIFPNIEVFSEPKQGRVEIEITPYKAGRVCFEGSRWPARLYHPNCQDTIPLGKAVLVVGIEGMTLLVVTNDYLEPLKNHPPRLADKNQEPLGVNVQTGFIPKPTRPADLTDIPCYEFTPRDIEAIQPEPKTRFPKVVRPADITDIPCYEFTPIDLEAQLNLTNGANCSNK